MEEELIKSFPWKISLTGNPYSTNSLYKTGRGHMYMTKKGKLLKEDYTKQATKQWKNRKVLTCDIEIVVFLYFSFKTRRDWDNFHKISMDSLTGIVWKDDSQISMAVVSKRIDKENPRIEIYVRKTKIN